MLPKNNFGLANVRNWILNRAEHPFWMIDDDITGWSEVINQRLWHCPGEEALLAAQQAISFAPDWGLLGLEYGQFAWAAKKEFNKNSYCEVVWAFNNIGNAQFDTAIPAKEDRDFCLQVLRQGKNTYRYTQFAFNCPENGSNAGGLADVYASGKERLACEILEKKWGKEICEIYTKKNGRKDIKWRWSQARQSATGPATTT